MFPKVPAPGGGTAGPEAEGPVSGQLRDLPAFAPPAARIAHTQEPLTRWAAVIFQSAFRSHPKVTTASGNPGVEAHAPWERHRTRGPCPSGQTRPFTALQTPRPRARLWHEVAVSIATGTFAGSVSDCRTNASP